MIPATHTTHNVHTKQSTIMKIEISTTQGNAHSTHSLLYTLTHTFKIQIEAQRKQWRKIRGYEIYFGYEFQQQQQQKEIRIK